MGLKSYTLLWVPLGLLEQRDVERWGCFPSALCTDRHPLEGWIFVLEKGRQMGFTASCSVSHERFECSNV